MGGTTRVEGGSRNPKFPYRHHCRRWIYDPPVATILILYHQSLLVLLPPCSLELPRPLYLSAILASSASVSKSFNDTHAPIPLPSPDAVFLLLHYASIRCCCGSIRRSSRVPKKARRPCMHPSKFLRPAPRRWVTFHPPSANPDDDFALSSLHVRRRSSSGE